MRQLKMPYARGLAPELLATAKAQRWEPVEIVKALLVEEVTGRGRSMLASRRKAAGFPTGMTFAAWDPAVSSIPAPHAAKRCAPWNGCTGGRTWWSADPRGLGRRSFSKPSVKP